MTDPRVPPADLSPSQQMWQFIWPAMGAAQAIYVAARLGIADLLTAGPKTADELARATNADAASLHRVLRALAGLGIFAENAAGGIENTERSATLRGDHPESVRAWAIMLGAPFVWQPWGNLHHAVATGQPAFDHVYGTSFFAHLAGHPDDAAAFNAAMSSASSGERSPIVEAYDFSRCACVVDVGGGQGALLHGILEANPTVRGILYDLPAVVAGAAALRNGALAARCEIEGGDFFAAVPAGADTYVLKHVIHDWNDEDALKILKNCRRAIRHDGRLLLVEGILKPANQPDPAKFLDLMMLVLVEGRERTDSDFNTLLRDAGFSVTRTIPTAGLSSIIESRPL